MSPYGGCQVASTMMPNMMNFDAMKADFYCRMGINSQRGVPLREALEACGMAEEADRVWPL